MWGMRGMLHFPAIKLVRFAYIICSFYINIHILRTYSQIALPHIVRATAYTVHECTPK
jgi:hypothetical protein